MVNATKGTKCAEAEDLCKVMVRPCRGDLLERCSHGCKSITLENGNQGGLALGLAELLAARGPALLDEDVCRLRMLSALRLEADGPPSPHW